MGTAAGGGDEVSAAVGAPNVGTSIIADPGAAGAEMAAGETSMIGSGVGTASATTGGGSALGADTGGGGGGAEGGATGAGGPAYGTGSTGDAATAAAVSRTPQLPQNVAPTRVGAPQEEQLKVEPHRVAMSRRYPATFGRRYPWT